MNYQLINGRAAIRILSVLTFISLFAAAAFAQIVLSPKVVQLAAEKVKLDAKRDVAYDMGVNIGFGRYQAEVTQTEFPNKNSKIYGPAMNLRTAAFSKANVDAQAINSVLSSESDKLDIKQFYQYSDGFSHEADALKVAKDIEINIEFKLKSINNNLFEAFVLGYATGVAEAYATGGESKRPYISNFLQLSNDYAKKIKIYNEAGGTLQKLAEGKTPVSEIYPKIVSLRQWYASAVKNIK